MINRRNIKTRRNFSRKPSKASRFFYYISFLAFLGSLGYVLFFSPYLMVARVDIYGTEDLDSQAISENVNSQISGTYFNFIAKNNLLLIRKGGIEDELSERFKKIETVRVEKIFPSSLNVRIRERELVLFFESAGSVWVMDRKGSAFHLSDFGSEINEDKELITIHDESEKPVEREKELLDQDYIDFVLGIKEKLKQEIDIDADNKFLISSLVSPDIQVKTREGWKIYFSREGELKKEVDMLKVVLENSISPNDRPNLEYVDLRIDNKVFYKFKDGTRQESDKETEENQPEVKPVEVKKEKKKKK